MAPADGPVRSSRNCSTRRSSSCRSGTIPKARSVGRGVRGGADGRQRGVPSTRGQPASGHHLRCTGHAATKRVPSAAGLAQGAGGRTVPSRRAGHRHQPSRRRVAPGARELLFLLLGAPLGSLLGRAAKRHDERKDWYRKVVVELSAFEQEVVRPISDEHLTNRCLQLDELLRDEIRFHGTGGDHQAVLRSWERLGEALRAPHESPRLLQMRIQETVSDLLTYFVPKAR
jgi:hypothetical protein